MGNGSEMLELSDLAYISGEEPGLPARASLRDKRVLVADDEAARRWSYVGLLRTAGARVSEARDGVEALERARTTRPELIVAGVRLPRLDGLGLCSAVRNQPELEGMTVVLLGDGQPPQALWEPRTGSRPLVDALVALLRDHRPARAGATPDHPMDRDPSERENLRAQSAVAMFREPANRAPRSAQPVWRVGTRDERTANRRVPAFDGELRVMSRILGGGFVALVAATVALILFQQARVPSVPETRPVPEPAAHERAIDTTPSTPPRVEAEVPPRVGLFEFSGVLRPGLDAGLGAGPGQGVLEVSGPTDTQVVIDGIDRGSLPIELVVDEGRHAVRYVRGDRFTVRFYYVKAGATRALKVVSRSDGFVDAR